MTDLLPDLLEAVDDGDAGDCVDSGERLQAHPCQVVLAGDLAKVDDGLQWEVEIRGVMIPFFPGIGIIVVFTRRWLESESYRIDSFMEPILPLESILVVESIQVVQSVLVIECILFMEYILLVELILIV